MRKFLAFILLAAGSLVVGGGASFAAEEASPKAVSSPEAAPPQPSQRKMHQSMQRKEHQLSQRKMRRMQKAGSGKPPQSSSAAEQAQVQTEGAPNPSQRSMRQKLREANKPNQTPATDNPESR